MKKIIFFVLLLSLVSEGSKAQNYGTKDPGTSGILKRTTRSVTVIATPGVDYVIPSAISNVNNTSDANKPISTATQTALDGKAGASHTHPATEITGLDATHRWWTDALNSTLTGKQAALVSGTSIKTINGNSLLGSGDLTITGGSGGGVAYKAYSDASYASTINLNFDATTNTNIPAVSGNITFTGTNNTSGKYYTVQLTKSTASDVVIYFNATNFPLARLISYTLLSKPSLVSSPRSFTLTGPSGTQFLLNIDMLPAGPYITITNIADSDYPVVQKANILNLKNFTPMASPGSTQAETILYTWMMPANTLSDSSTVTFDYLVTTGGGGNIQWKIRVCPGASTTLSSCPTVEDIGISGAGSYRRQAVMTNTGSVASQSIQPGYVEVSNPVGEQTRTIDFSQNQWFKFTIEKQGSSGQTGTMGRIRINGEGL